MSVEGVPIRIEHMEGNMSGLRPLMNFCRERSRVLFVLRRSLNTGTEAGRVTKYMVDERGNAKVDFELERGGGIGHFVDELIQSGDMAQLSLQHVKHCHDACCSRSTLVPLEVSVCKQGARPNSRISRGA